MGESRWNPNSIAKANGQPLPPKNAQRVAVMNLGDDYVIVADGCAIRPAVNQSGEVCFLLTAMAGKTSTIAGLQAGEFLIGEVGKIAVADLRAKIDRMLNPEMEEPAAAPVEVVA